MGQMYYGSCESFLWCLNNNRRVPCKSLLERAKLESNVEIFKWTGENRNIQMANRKILAVGGGEPDKVIERRLLSSNSSVCIPSEGQGQSEEEQGADFGLALNADLSSGSSGRCVTFGTSSGLSKKGCTFEVSNAEVWTLTPMPDIPQAEKLELGRQFVFSSIMTSAKVKQSINRKMPRAA